MEKKVNAFKDGFLILLGMVKLFFYKNNSFMLCKNKIFIFVVFSFSLIIGLIFDENAGGGAKIDQEYLLKYIFKLSDNLDDGLNYSLVILEH